MVPNAVSKQVGLLARPVCSRRNINLAGSPLRSRHLGNQTAEKPSEESVFGSRSPPSRRGGVYSSHPLLELFRCISSTVNRNVQACPRGRGKLIGDVPAATAILDRFLHHVEMISITGKSYRLRHQSTSLTDGSEESKPAIAPTGSQASHTDTPDGKPGTNDPKRKKGTANTPETTMRDKVKDSGDNFEVQQEMRRNPLLPSAMMRN